MEELHFTKKIKRVWKLLKAGTDGWTDLHHAAKNGSLEVVQHLITLGVDLDAKTPSGYAPLIIAAVMRSLSIVELLIDSGADIHCSTRGFTVLHFAARNGWLEVVQSLINKGVHLNAKSSTGYTPLLYAAVSDSPQSVIELLIDAGADVNSCTPIGLTVLHCAAVDGWLEVAKLLIKKGAHLYSETCSGDTPLLYAARWNKCFVELLLASGVDPLSLDNDGWTLLHFASRNGWRELVQSLIKKGVDCNAETSLGDTPLHLVYNRLEMMRDLLEAGGDCNIENRDGITPFNKFTRRLFSIEQIALCIEHGAYFKNIDYCNIIKNSIFTTGILKNISICSQGIINKFNNRDLPALYKLSLKKLPRIEVMKIANNSNAALTVKQAVKYEIETKGHCNVLEASPILSILSIKSLLDYYDVKKNILS